MRVVLDTNILISALMISTGNPAAIYRIWLEGHFTLLTCSEHLDELRATLGNPSIAQRIKPYNAGGLVRKYKNLPRTLRECRASAALLTPPTTSCWRCLKQAMPIIW